ncbi:MAG: hypothetical protein V4722_04415 [Bacteroidota bacterium]
MVDYYVNTWGPTGKLIAQTLVHSHAEGCREKAEAEKKYPFVNGYSTYICPVKLKTGFIGFEQQELFPTDNLIS